MLLHIANMHLRTYKTYLPSYMSTCAQETADARKRQRETDHRAPALLPPLPDQEAGNRARAITQTIEKNRGLTPHRCERNRFGNVCCSVGARLVWI